MALERRNTYFPGGRNHSVILPLSQPSKDEIYTGDEKPVEDPVPKLSLVSRTTSRPIMRLSLKNSDNPWTQYRKTYAVDNAGRGIVAQRKGQVR
jgi:hypothetical protein